LRFSPPAEAIASAIAGRFVPLSAECSPTHSTTLRAGFFARPQSEQ